jgi:hypothetical protein
MNEYTFEMYVDVTEQTTIKAKSEEEARCILHSSDCEWEEVKSQGGDIVLVGEQEVSNE